MQEGDQGADAKAQGAAPATDEVARKTPKRVALKHVVKLSEVAKHHAHKYGRAILITTGTVSVMTAAVWLVGNLYIGQYKLGNQTIPIRTADANLRKMVSGAAQQYKLRVVGKAGDAKEYSLQEMGLQPDVNATLATLRNQAHGWRHRLEWWQPLPVTLTAKVDMVALNNFISHHITTTLKAARNAKISMHGGVVRLTAASDGEAYGLADPVTTILSAAEQFKTTPLQLHEVATQPILTESSLASVQDSLQKILHQHIDVRIAGKDITPQPEDIAKWVRLTPKPHTSEVRISVDKTSVQAYISTLAAKYEHPPRAQLIVPGGAAISGERGVVIRDQQAAVSSIRKNLTAAKGMNLTMPAQYMPFNTINARVYNKWFDVDLTTHRMYAFQGSNLVRTFLVSAGKYSTPTVTGDFAIYSKYTSQTMIGADYVQPNVPWVNYFYRDFAIHGNYWSPSSYFGSFNASHGCVGVNVGDAAWIYTWAPIGTHVEIHA